MVQLYFLGDNVFNIWNDLSPQRWHQPVINTWPGFATAAAFTLAHYILNILIDSRARLYAEKAVLSDTNAMQLISRPKWMSDTLYKEICSIDSSKSLSKKLAKLVCNDKKLNKTEQTELILYHKQLISISKNVSKFKESFFKVIIFGVVYFYGIFMLFDTELTAFYWNFGYVCDHGWPQSAGNLSNILNLNNYYWLQIGYHFHRAIYQFFEHSRKDFVAMFIHHWVTVLLLCGSFAAGYQQTGSIVLLSNDNVDLLLPVSKLVGYLGWKRLHTVLYMLFGVAWIPCRVILYPQKVLLPFLAEECAYREHLRPYLLHWLHMIGLFVIYLLQIYWTQFLFKSVYRNIVGYKGSNLDSRSDDENDLTKEVEKVMKKNEKAR